MRTLSEINLGKGKRFGLLVALFLLLAVENSSFQHGGTNVNLRRTHAAGSAASASIAARGSRDYQQHLHPLRRGNTRATGLSHLWFRSKSCRNRAVVGMGASSSSQQKTALIGGGDGGSGGGYGAAAVSPLGAAHSSTDGADPEDPRTGALGPLAA